MKTLILILLFSVEAVFSQKISTAAPNVHIISKDFAVPQLSTCRRIWIYLPPGYARNHKRYPVIYMHDGQNLFDDHTSYSGEWQVDESLNKLFAKTGKSAIVIGIDNGEESRIAELSPFKNERYGGGEGARYAEFIVETLKPYVERHYRVKRGMENSMIGGSSLGALISVYSAVKYPKTFGKILAFSPAFWFNSKELNSFISSSKYSFKHQKYYFIQGKHEDDNMEKESLTVIKNLEKKGAKPQNIYYRSDEEGKHNELYWRREFPAAILWLLK